MSPRRLSIAFLAALGLVAACGKKAAAPLKISTAPIERRTIVVQAEATGIIEPINVVEVKSRASGQIIEMPVETGTLDPSPVLDTTLGLEEVPEGYAAMDERRALKVLVRTGAA